MNTCPYSANDLSNYYLLCSFDKIADDQIGRHVERCPRCQSIVERLLRNQGASASGHLGESDATSKRMLEAVANNPPVPPSWALAEVVPTRASLAIEFPDTPSERGRLGRLDTYHIIAILGEGAYGVVFRAYDETLKREVAIKVLRPELAKITDLYERFLEEAQAAARIKNPHVVIIHKVEKGAAHFPQPYIVMELVDGEPLTNRLTRPFSCQEAARIVQEVALALTAAHGRGVLHRDIKPDNILLERNTKGPETTKLADFGIAKFLAAAQQTSGGSVVGTPHYMSPEAWRAPADVDHRADLYSLGVVFYQLLTGCLPHEGENDEIRRQAMSDCVPVSPRTRNPTVPRDLNAIIIKLLAKEPDNRYVSAATLAEHLVRWQRGEPVPIRHHSYGEIIWLWCRRNPAWAVLVAIIAVALVSIGWSISWVESERQLVEAEKLERIKQQGVAVEMTRLRGIADENRQEAVKQRGLARELLYLAKMRRVGGAIEQKYFAEAIGLLGEWVPAANETEDYRGFEWYYNWRFCHRGSNFQGHSGPVAHVAFCPRGERLVSCGGAWDGDRREYVGGEVRMWDLKAARETHSFRGHKDIVNGVAFSPDGNKLATASKDGTIKVWDVSTGKELFTLKGHRGEVRCVAYSRDGKHLASGGEDSTARLWDTGTGREIQILRGHQRWFVFGVAFSPDDKLLASAGWDSTVRVWDVLTGRETLVYKGHASGVTSVAFSPDGRRIASASWDESVKVWDTATGKNIVTYEEHEGRVNTVAFSPDGKRIASSSDRTVKVWDATTGKDAFELSGHNGQVLCVTFNSAGTQLASASADQTVKVWDAKRSQEDLALKHGDVVSGLAFSPDGKRLASGGWDNNVHVWEVESGRQVVSISAHKAAVTSVAFSPNGEWIATGSNDKTGAIWNSSTGEKKVSLVGHTERVTSVAFSRDGTRLASGSADNTVKVWDAASGRELFTYKDHTKPVTSVAYNPVGSLLASASEDQTVKLWNASGGDAPSVTISTRGSPVWCISFSPDGQRLAGGCWRDAPNMPGEIKVWDSTDGREITMIRDNRFFGRITAITFSPDGKRLASAHGQLFGVPVWDVATSQQVLDLQGHKNVVKSVAFSPDGKRLATGGLDLMVRVWDGSPYE